MLLVVKRFGEVTCTKGALAEMVSRAIFETRWPVLSRLILSGYIAFSRLNADNDRY